MHHPAGHLQVAAETAVRSRAGRPAGVSVSWGAWAVRAPAPTIEALDEPDHEAGHGLEQDTAITADEPAVTVSPMLPATESIAFRNPAHRTEEINQ